MIIAVEDNVFDQELLQEVTNRKITFFNSAEAVQRHFAKESFESVSLFISDYMLPGLDGIGLVSWLRKQPTAKHVPCLLLSVSMPPEAISRALAMGVLEVFEKPTTSDAWKAIGAAVEAHLG